jgi:hypothetical protein
VTHNSDSVILVYVAVFEMLLFVVDDDDVEVSGEESLATFFDFEDGKHGITLLGPAIGMLAISSWYDANLL